MTSDSRDSSIFFPCNREDALLLIGGLCVSTAAPAAELALAVSGDALFFVEGGVRAAEENLLHGGDPRRFVLLMEVEARSACQGMFSVADVRSLVFRTTEEADDFRFRPVDEADPEWFKSIRVDASLFGLDGTPRFSLRAPQSEAVLRGHAADRLAAAVLYVIDLAQQRTACRRAAASVLSQSADAQGLNFAIAAGVAGSAEHPSDGLEEHVCRAFMSAEPQRGPRGIIDALERTMLSGQSDSPEAMATAKGWTKTARGVLQNRVELRTELLTDEKSILLRGALLALSCDTPDSIATFLDAEQPAGTNVVVVAAFLCGLRQGLLNLSWAQKAARIEPAAVLASSLFAAARSHAHFDAQLTVSSSAANGSDVFRISSAGVTIAEWTVQVIRPSSDTKAGGEGAVMKVSTAGPLEAPIPSDSASLVDELAAAGYEVLGPGGAPDSARVRFPSGETIEVLVHRSAGSECRILRMYVEGRKQRKKKDVLAAFADGGMFWYPGVDKVGATYLSCDVFAVPAAASSSPLALKLSHAVDALYEPIKKPGRGRPRGKKSGAQLPLVQ